MAERASALVPLAAVRDGPDLRPPRGRAEAGDRSQRAHHGDRMELLTDRGAEAVAVGVDPAIGAQVRAQRRPRVPDRRRPLAAQPGLGAEPLGQPRLAVAPEADPVVEAARAALPELDGVGLERVAAPLRRPWDFLALEAPLVLRDRLVELGAARDHAALLGRPRS